VKPTFPVYLIKKGAALCWTWEVPQTKHFSCYTWPHSRTPKLYSRSCHGLLCCQFTATPLWRKIIYSTIELKLYYSVSLQ